MIADSDALLNDVVSDRFTLLHWSHFNATVNALVYAGRAWDAWSLVQQQWPLIQATGFLKLACIGAHVREIRTRASLKAAARMPVGMAIRPIPANEVIPPQILPSTL